MRNGHSRQNGDVLTDMVKGAIAGAAGTWAMNQVTEYMYWNQDPEAFRQDKQAQTEGKYATTVAAEKAGQAVGKELTLAQQKQLGVGIHWTMGMMFGAAHGALRGRVPAIGAGHGLLHGTIFWLLVDEGAKPLLGLSSGPTEFPWQAHARGLAGHLALGGVTDVVLDMLDRVT